MSVLPDSIWQLCASRRGGLQQFLRHHCLLVYIIHIRQVVVEGTGIQHLTALETLDIPCIPLGGGDTTLS